MLYYAKMIYLITFNVAMIMVVIFCVISANCEQVYFTIWSRCSYTCIDLRVFIITANRMQLDC